MLSRQYSISACWIILFRWSRRFVDILPISSHRLKCLKQQQLVWSIHPSAFPRVNMSWILLSVGLVLISIIRVPQQEFFLWNLCSKTAPWIPGQKVLRILQGWLGKIWDYVQDGWWDHWGKEVSIPMLECRVQFLSVPGRVNLEPYQASAHFFFHLWTFSYRSTHFTLPWTLRDMFPNSPIPAMNLKSTTTTTTTTTTNTLLLRCFPILCVGNLCNAGPKTVETSKKKHSRRTSKRDRTHNKGCVARLDGLWGSVDYVAHLRGKTGTFYQDLGPFVLGIWAGILCYFQQIVGT